jgi:hypothetical protein
MHPAQDLDALAIAGERVVLCADGLNGAPGHDIPHPIGDPDEDEGLPGDDDDDGTEDDEEEDEEPLQVRGRPPAQFSLRSRQTKILL